MRVLIADEHALFRTGLGLILVQVYEGDVEVAEADSFDKAVQALERGSGFDIVLVSLQLADMTPLDGLDRVVAAAGDTPVAVLSDTDHGEEIKASIQHGASGFIMKRQTVMVLRHALDLMRCGEVYVPAGALLPAGETQRDGRAPRAVATTAYGRELTPRQHAILDLIADGLTNKEIARELGITEGSVKIHVRSLFRKLGVSNRTQAARATFAQAAPQHRAASG